MLFFITATPGSGKTLYLINKLKDEKRKIYYHGIPELKLNWIEIKDPVNYPDEIDDGSIVVIDECSDHFPVRPAKIPPPLGIEFIRKHRHRGVDIYFITQHPSLLDHAARRLVGNHIHLQRNFGLERSVKYESNKLMDVTNWHDLQQAEKTQFKFPVEVYGLYKSAEVHTVKRRLPKKLLLIPLILSFIVGCVYYGYTTLFSNDSFQEVVQNDNHNIAENSTGQFFPSSLPTKKRKIEWSTDLIPEIKGIPYTAPIYQSLAKPVALPVISGCIAQGNDCKCYTQQATEVDMSFDQCMSYLENPSFNPFLKKRKKTERNSNVQEARQNRRNSSRSYFDGKTVFPST